MSDSRKDRWTRIDTCFRELLDLAPAEREEALARLRASEPEVADRVESLLANAARAGDTFERLSSMAAGVLGDALEEEGLPADGRIGPYRIGEIVGRGGGGSVYSAERVDGVYEKRVAIKILRRGLDTDDVLARFEGERRIMAGLEHRGIARLIDGGSLEDGRPYLVMEYVEGRPIDEFCAQNRLSCRERLALFLQVCDAVAYAHRGLVLHRDLKPSNILVRDDRTVCLLDFGIAKLLHDDPAVSLARTRPGVRLLTPQYGAPEQIEGGPVSVGTDVYQLGNLLHRLLTDASPYDVAPDAPMEALHAAIARGKVIAPSRTSPGPVGVDPRALRGDIDTIVLKAMREEPDRRYGSVDALASDVRAHLHGFPVSARPDTLRYRAGKLIRRNPVAAGLSTLAAILLVALSVVSLSYATTSAEQLGLIAVERDRAELEAMKAAEVTSYLTSLFEVADPSERGGEALSARTLLDRGVSRIDRIEAAPRIRAGLLVAMADAFRSLSAPEEAERLYRQALDLYRRESSGPDPDVASTLNNIGHALRSLGDRDGAASYYDRALEMRLALFGDHHPDVACSLNNLGLIHDLRGEFREAAQRYEQAIAMRESYVGRQSDCIATILRNLAGTYRTLGEYEKSRAAAREAMTILEARGETVTTGYASALTYLAAIERRTGDHDAAEQLLRQAIELEIRLHGEDAPRVASVWNDLGVLLNSRGQYADAEHAHRSAIAIRTARYGENDRRVANSLSNLGVVLLRQGRLDEADRVLTRSTAMQREHRGDHSTWTAHALHWHGQVLAELGELPAAEARLREALDLRTALLGEDHYQTEDTAERLAEVRRRIAGS